MDDPADGWHGDVALLAWALKAEDEIVVVTDDKPLRKACKALGILISGSLGVVIAAVERGDLAPEEAKGALVAMDEVGARLSARLLRRAERRIDEAAEG
jgi:predicted nucleic acid-binding protein